MEDNIAEIVEKAIKEISFADNKLTLWCDNERVIVGAMVVDNPRAEKFFSLSSLYNTIVDADKKIKYSLKRAADLTDVHDEKGWNPIQPPSENEWLAIYYAENAVFRVEVLWDLLAQIYNLLIDKGFSQDKIYTLRFFHDLQQGKHPDAFAKRVYEYMTEDEDETGETWSGSHKFLKEYRDKLTHRCSPNVTSLNNFATELRLPTTLVLYRLVIDYLQVVSFIQELVEKIGTEFEDYLSINSEE